MKNTVPLVCAALLLGGCSEESQWSALTERHAPPVYRSLSAEHYHVRTESRVAVGPSKPVVNQPVSQPQPAPARIASRPKPAPQPAGAPPSSGIAESSPAIPPSSTPPASSAMTQPEPITPPAQPSVPPPVAESQEKAPFATRVPGKPGYVLSPFAPDAGYIDTTGMSPGSEARDPYTGKVFRVP